MGARHLDWAVAFTTTTGELWFRLKSGSWVRHGSRTAIEGAGNQASYRAPSAPAWHLERDARRYTKTSAQKAARSLVRHYEVLSLTYEPHLGRGVLARGDELAMVNRTRLVAVEIDAGIAALAELAEVE